jgi:hypothetical protein
VADRHDVTVSIAWQQSADATGATWSAWWWTIFGESDGWRCSKTSAWPREESEVDWCLGRDVNPSNERAIFPEDLDTVSMPIAYIDEAIRRDAYTMDTEKLPLARAGGEVELSGIRNKPVLFCKKLQIDGAFSVGTLMALVCARIRVKYDDAAVVVPVGNVHFIGFRVDG